MFKTTTAYFLTYAFADLIFGKNILYNLNMLPKQFADRKYLETVSTVWQLMAQFDEIS